jgi:hypothetical protein
MFGRLICVGSASEIRKGKNDTEIRGRGDMEKQKVGGEFGKWGDE